MNILIFIANRIYAFQYKMDKGDKHSALLGTILLIALLIFINVLNIIGIIYAFRNDYFKPNSNFIFILIGIIAIFIAIVFVRKSKNAIRNRKLKVPLWKDLLVLLIFVLTTTIFVVFTGINREKIFAEQKAKHPIEQPVKQNSLESKIRDWWNNRDK